jgi:putative oxidoreductase
MAALARVVELAVPPLEGRWARPALWARVVSGAIFVLFGLGKFTSHAHETESFHRYGLPQPGTFAYVIGVLEVVGGLLLLAGLLVRPVALALVGDLVGAISTAGRIDGGPIHLGLAPALLVVTLALVLSGAGERSADAHLARALGLRRPAPQHEAAELVGAPHEHGERREHR